MGIHGLYKFLAKIAKTAGPNSGIITDFIPSQHLVNKRVGIDATLYWCRRFYTLNSNASDTEVVSSLVDYTADRHNYLVNQGVNCSVWFVDGVPQNNKSITLAKRQERRESNLKDAEKSAIELQQIETQITTINKQMDDLRDKAQTISSGDAVDENQLNQVISHYQKQRQELMSLSMKATLAEQQKGKYEMRSRKLSKRIVDKVISALRLHGISVVQCESEVDFQMAHCLLTNQLDLVCTDDSDAICYGLNNISRSLFWDEKPQTEWRSSSNQSQNEDEECNKLPPSQTNQTNQSTTSRFQLIHAQPLLNFMGWSHKKWIEFCLLLGHDDATRISGIAEVSAKALMDHYGSVEAIVAAWNEFQNHKKNNTEPQQIAQTDDGRNYLDSTAAAAPANHSSSSSVKRKQPHHESNESGEPGSKRHKSDDVSAASASSSSYSVPDSMIKHLTKIKTIPENLLEVFAIETDLFLHPPNGFGELTLDEVVFNQTQLQQQKAQSEMKQLYKIYEEETQTTTDTNQDDDEYGSNSFQIAE